MVDENGNRGREKNRDLFMCDVCVIESERDLLSNVEREEECVQAVSLKEARLSF